jgi:hypothetical protein
MYVGEDVLQNMLPERLIALHSGTSVNSVLHLQLFKECGVAHTVSFGRPLD